jgi:hypothetical protein
MSIACRTVRNSGAASGEVGLRAARISERTASAIARRSSGEMLALLDRHGMPRLPNLERVTKQNTDEVAIPFKHFRYV